VSLRAEQTLLNVFALPGADSHRYDKRSNSRAHSENRYQRNHGYDGLLASGP
jgi:hypothetical protein